MIRRLIAIVFIAGTAALIAYLTLFTAYAPDAYVFARYAGVDNTARTVTMSSLLNNNLLYDLLTVAGDRLGFTTGLEYLLGVAIISIAVFVAKYSVLLRHGKLSDVMLLCAVSFFLIDLNQLRFNIALCLLIAGLYATSRWRYAYLTGSALTHVVPLPLHLSQRAYYLPVIVFVPSALVFLRDNSRLYEYINANEQGMFKSLLFVFPFLWCYFDQKFVRLQREPVMELGLAFAICGLGALAISTTVAARFFETAFVLAAWSNVIKPLSQASRVVLLVFACGALASRGIAGINAGENDFTEQFRLSPQEYLGTWSIP